MHDGRLTNQLQDPKRAMTLQRKPRVDVVEVLSRHGATKHGSKGRGLSAHDLLEGLAIGQNVMHVLRFRAVHEFNLCWIWRSIATQHIVGSFEVVNIPRYAQKIEFVNNDRSVSVDRRWQDESCTMKLNSEQTQRHISRECA